MRERDDSWIFVLIAMGLGAMTLYRWYVKKDEPEEGIIRLY